MKALKSSAVVLLAVVFCLVLLPQSSEAEQKIGIGGKLVGEIPFLIGSLDFNQLGIEVGGGMKSTSTGSMGYSFDASLTYYLANGKYIVPVNPRFQPYLGGGIVGTNVSVTASYEGTTETVSASTTGYDIFAGLQVPLDDYGLPLTIFGGGNYLDFGDMTFTYGGESITYPLGISGPSFHVGVKFTF